MPGFNTDLNPKKSGMDLGDLLKMDDAMTKRKLYSDAAKVKSMQKTATPGANAVLAKTDMLKSDAADMGVPFKFGNNYQSED
jgi:hypothetical protein